MLEISDFRIQNPECFVCCMLYVCIYVCMYVYVCMHVCVCVYVNCASARMYVGRRLLCERTDLIYIDIRYTIYETPAPDVHSLRVGGARVRGCAITCARSSRPPPSALLHVD